MYSFSWLNLPTLISDYNSFFFPYKSIRDQIWPCCKIGQSQPRVIIWIYLVVLKYPMLHTNFQGHQLFGSREEDFLIFLHIWAWRPHWSLTWTIWTNFHSPSHGGSTWNLASIGQAVSKEKKLENVVNLSDLGPRSMNDLDLWYSYRFMYLFS